MARTPETAAPAASSTSGRTRTGSRSSSLTRIATTCAAGVCLVGGCAADPTAAASAMNVTVSTVTDAPVRIYVDTRERGRSGQAGRNTPATPVDLSPQRPSAVLTVPYDPGYWLRVRVAGPPDRPAGMTLGCELRAGDGRLLAVDATDPFDPPTEDASCAGAG